jgi:hypothetical protein
MNAKETNSVGNIGPQRRKENQKKRQIHRNDALPNGTETLTGLLWG